MCNTNKIKLIHKNNNQLHHDTDMLQYVEVQAVEVNAFYYSGFLAGPAEPCIALWSLTLSQRWHDDSEHVTVCKTEVQRVDIWIQLAKNATFPPICGQGYLRVPPSQCIDKYCHLLENLVFTAQPAQLSSYLFSRWLNFFWRFGSSAKVKLRGNSWKATMELEFFLSTNTFTWFLKTFMETLTLDQCFFVLFFKHSFLNISYTSKIMAHKIILLLFSQ